MAAVKTNLKNTLGHGAIRKYSTGMVRVTQATIQQKCLLFS